MTKDEFEKGYAERSGMTLEHFREIGLHGVPCECDYEHCTGWKVDSGLMYEAWKRIATVLSPGVGLL